MTEKRLFGTVKGHREHIVDNTGRLYSDGEVANLLNEQHETIQRLEAQLSHLEYRFTEYRMKVGDVE